MGAFISQCYPPKPTFSVDQIPDLTGKVAIVTGSNTGIGKETVKALLNKNAKVYLAARSKEKADVAIASLKTDTGKDAVFLELDLASLDSIKNAVDEFKNKESELHILFNNAGVMRCSKSLLTKDGYDMQFGTNALGHYYLTKLLLPTLISTAGSSSDHKARIITTSSLSHMQAPTGGVVLETLKGDSAEVMKLKNGINGNSFYGQSKWANVVMSNEIAKEYADQGIIAIAVNPGNLKTELQRHVAGPTPGVASKVISTLLLHPAPLGALSQLWAGTTKDALDYNGKYVWPWARPGKPARDDTRDPELSKKLMDWMNKELEGRV